MTLFKGLILTLSLCFFSPSLAFTQTDDCAKAFTKRIPQNKRLERWRTDQFQTKYVILFQGMNRIFAAQLNYRDDQTYLTLISESSSTIVARAYALTPRQVIHLYLSNGEEMEITFPREGLEYRKLQAKFYRNDIALSAEQLALLIEHTINSIEVENPFDKEDTDSAVITVGMGKRPKFKKRAACFRDRIVTEKGPLSKNE